ncbi:histone H4 transcription factor-like [Eriocheir sinensis]|uniref:histone H4 transcription factor-like n=1 Tax=Eriocheir sinensis TaxID=95602 RepID=UPI0021C80FD0|nr:histone H4 transcription factor-like [Eriocheir sinensis]XP_050702225.1 histone H4 transcription factor-like [Eriocheir sinensis]
MPRKRKASKALHELWDEEEEVGCGLPAETLLHEGAFSSTKDTLQQPMGGGSPMGYTCERGNRGGTSESDDSRSHSGRNRKANKRPRMSEEALLKKMVITCEWNMCSKEYQKVEHFMAHITEHLQAITEPESNDGYLCYWRECEFSCSAKEEMDRHVYFHAFHTKIKSIGAVIMEERDEKCILDSHGRNLIPEVPEPFQCLWDDCNVEFASAHTFYCHTEGHVRSADQEDSGKGYICAWKGCFSSFSRLRGHVISHTQEKTVGCPNCGALFASHSGLLEHCVRQIPLESQQYKCSHCSKRFPSEPLLRAHLRLHISRYKCPECEWTTHFKHTLEKHIFYCHKKDRPHKCLECGKRFAYVNDLNRHLPVHSVEPAYGCDFPNCTYTSRALTCLNNHIKVAHNGYAKQHYACHLCESKYTIGANLSRHLVKIHSLDRPAGHSRFRYNLDEDGFYRLQMVCYESIEQETVGEREEDDEAVDSPEALPCPLSPASLSTQGSQLSPGVPSLPQSKCEFISL